MTLSRNAIWTLHDVANGSRLFALCAEPHGWAELERKGLARRIEGDRAELTAEGEAVLQGLLADAVAS